jgi:hypothetical protein
MSDEIQWYSYEYERPQQNLPIIVRQRHNEGYQELVLVPEQMHPETNVANLEWRPTGIFTELGGIINHYNSQQANACNTLSVLLGGLAGLGVSGRSYANQLGGLSSHPNFWDPESRDPESAKKRRWSR